MKKVYLIESKQHGFISYVGSISGKDFVKLAKAVEFKTVQDAQRPIDPKRVEEISTFVADNGNLSTSIVIGTRDERIKVTKEKIPSVYSMEFPETDEEFEEYRDAFDIMDGQHRLFSFLPDYNKLPDEEVFEVSFNMYLQPTMRERRLIFKNTNEKQKTVDSNLIMWFRAQLGLLTSKEQNYHGVVSLLNSEVASPLKDRIIMGAEKIKGGFKAEQVISILDKSNIKYIAPTDLTDEKMLKLLINYLKGWEDAVGTRFSAKDVYYGAFSKISGFRFMILLLKAFYDRAIAEKTSFNSNFVSSKLKALLASEGYEPADLFAKDSEYLKNLGSNPYSAETPITEHAKIWEKKLSNLTAGTFDPLA